MTLITGTEGYPDSAYIERDDFESGFNPQWKIDEFIESATPPYATIIGNRPPIYNSPQIVPTYSGEGPNSAVKFSITSEDEYDWENEDGTIQAARVYKSELGQDPVEMNSEYIYRFRNLVPVSDDADSSKQTVIAQWHDVPDVSAGERFRNPPLSLMTKDNKFYVSNKWASAEVNTNSEIDGEEVFDLGAYQEHIWYDWTVHVKWSHQDDGFIEIWKNDELVVSKVGPNTYNDAFAPYLRLGIYQTGGWENRTATLKELYLDDVEVVEVQGGPQNLVGDAEDNIYTLSSQSAAGSQITDPGGSDTLNLSDLTLDSSSFDRSGNNLIVDIDRNGEFDTASDLTITDFWSATGTGTGYMETLDDLSGTEVINLFSEEATVTEPLAEETAVVAPVALRLEAENFQLQNYALDESGYASGGQLISLSGPSGTAATTIDELSGTYDITVGYFDESDGTAELQVQLNGSPVGTISLDRDLGSGGVNQLTFQETTLENVTLTAGDVLTVLGIASNNEFARIDYIDLSPVPTDELVTSGDV